VRIAVDGSCWATRRGFGRFTRCLLSEMVHRDTANVYVVLLDSASAQDDDLPPLPPGVDVEIARVDVAPAEAAAAAGRRGIADMARMTVALRRIKSDVVFFPATYSYFPVVGPPSVVVVHDAIAERLPALTLPGRGDRIRWRLKQEVAVRRAEVVITVSEASRRAIVETLGVSDSKVHVIREAPADAFRPVPASETSAALARLGLADDPYLLYVGGISPHKNIEVLIEAFEVVAAGHEDLRLLLVGEVDDDPFLSSVAAVRSAIDRSPASRRIVLTGFVPDDDLAALYSGALATVLPSLAEGFGLPAAESAACGTPVVASRDPALVELLGDTGLYAAADRPSEFAVHFEAMIADDDRRRLCATAVAERAATWSWGHAAEATIAILEQAARHG